MVNNSMNDSEMMSFPGLELDADAVVKLQKQVVQGIQVGIKAYAVSNNGECPSNIVDALPNHISDGSGFEYGIGCHLPDTCRCPKSPFMVCATAPRWSDPGVATKQFINQFGYCRTGNWVFIATGLLVLGVVASLIYFLKK